MLLEPFHIRDLSVLAHGFAKVGVFNSELAERIAARSLATISDCSAQELARLLTAFTISKNLHLCDELWTLGLNYVGDKLLFLSAQQLVDSSFAFGQILEVLPQNEKKRLDTLFERIRYSAVSGIILFQPKEILAFIHSYARWKIAFDADDLAIVADRVRQVRPWNGGQRGVQTSINIIHCLALLVH